MYWRNWAERPKMTEVHIIYKSTDSRYIYYCGVQSEIGPASMLYEASAAYCKPCEWGIVATKEAG